MVKKTFCIIFFNWGAKMTCLTHLYAVESGGKKRNKFGPEIMLYHTFTDGREEEKNII
jgi:hypothetical protein